MHAAIAQAPACVFLDSIILIKMDGGGKMRESRFKKLVVVRLLYPRWVGSVTASGQQTKVVRLFGTQLCSR